MKTQHGRAALILLAAILALAAVAWWYFAPDTLPVAVRHLTPPSPNLSAAPQALYKWRDEKGQLHVTDVAPKDRPYETVRYNPDTNVVPAYHKPGEKAETQ